MIDWNKRTITGKSGTIYKIDPTGIKFGRYGEYQALCIELAYHMDVKKMFITLGEIINDVDNVQKLGDIIAIREKIVGLQKGISEFLENDIHRIFRFCMLFCNAEGEDDSTFTNDQIKVKYEDWKGINANDFFLLASKAIPYFSELYKVEVEKLVKIQESNTIEETL